MDTCICMAASLSCSPETITTLLIGYTQIQNKTLKKIKYPFVTKKKVTMNLYSHYHDRDLCQKGELINEYSKVAGYKINERKSLAFLYTNNEITEGEIKETIPFALATKRIKYLGVNLPKETKDLYIENCKTLMKEIKSDTKRWKNIPFYGSE